MHLDIVVVGSTRGGTSMVVFEKCNRGCNSDGRPPKCNTFKNLGELQMTLRFLRL